MLAAGSPIHVRKLRPDGSQAFAWDGVVLRCDAAGIVLRAHFNVDLVDLGFTTFRRGDEFVEFYYWDRDYNVFQVSSPDGTLEGLVCQRRAAGRVGGRRASCVTSTWRWTSGPTRTVSSWCSTRTSSTSW